MFASTRRSCTRRAPEVGVATANMLPQFTISAGLGNFAAAAINPSAFWSGVSRDR